MVQTKIISRPPAKAMVRPPAAPLPVATKRTAVGAKASPVVTDIWDFVKPVDRMPEYIHVSLYGRSKTGKTRLISTFPKPILIIGAEDGTLSIIGAEGVQFVRIRTSSDCFTLIDQAISRGFKTVALDTASALQERVLAEILKIPQLPEQMSWGTATREQWGQCSLQVKTILGRLLGLPCNVVVTAHERNFNDEAKGADDLIPAIGSALSPSVTGWLNGETDYICQTYIRSQKIEKVIEANGKKVTQLIDTGKPEFCLRTGPHPIYMTGFRIPIGRVLPDLITDPTYDKIMEVITGKHS